MYLKFFSILLLSVITVQAFHLPPDSEMEDIFGEEVANKYNRLSYQFDSNEKPNDLTANNIGQHKSKSEVKGHTHSDKIIFPSTFHHFPPYLPDPTEDDNTNENVNFEDKNTFENKINDIPMVFTNVALKPVIQNKPIIFPTDERYIISKTETKSDESDNESDISTGNLNEKLTDTNSIETYFLNRLFSIRKQNNKIDQSDESDESDESKESDESNKTNQQTSLENLLSDIFADESTSTEKQNNEESINKPNPPETTENNLDKEHQQSDDLEKLMKIIFDPFGIVELNKQIPNDDTKNLMKEIFDISDESVESKNNETSDKDIKKLMNIIFGDELESVDESHEDNTHNEQPSNEIISTSINPLPKKARSTSEENKFGEDDHKFMEDCIQAKFNNIKHIFNLFFDFNKIIEIESNCLEQRKAFKEKNEMYPFKTDKSNKDEIADSLVEIEKAIEKKEDNKNTYTDDETASVTKTKDLMKEIFDISDESVESKNKEISDEDTRKVIKIIFGPFHESDEIESVDESHEDNTHNEQPSNEIISTSINPLPKKARSTSEENKFAEDDHKFMEECIQAKFNNIKHIFNPFFDFIKIIEIESNCLEQRKAFKEKNEIYPFKTDKSNEDEIEDPLYETFGFPIKKKEESKNTYTDDETASVTKTKDLMKDISDISDESVESKNNETSDKDIKKLMNIIFGDELESVDESHEDNTHNEQPSNEIISTSINPLPKKARSTSEENKFGEDDHKFMEDCIQAKFNNIKHIFNLFFDFNKIIEIESNCLEQRKAFKEKNEMYPFKTDKSNKDEIADSLVEIEKAIEKKEDNKNTYTDDETASVTKTKDLMKEIFDISDESVESKNKEISDEDTRKVIKIIFGPFHESDEIESVDESHEDNTHNEQPSNEIISTSINPLPKKARSTSEENKFAEDDHKFMEECIQAKFNNIKHIFNPFFDFIKIIEIESNCLEQRKAFKEKNEIHPFKTDKSSEDEIEDPLYETFGFPIKKKEESKNTYTDDEIASVTTSPNVKDMNEENDEKDTEKIEENDNVNANRDIDEEIVTQSYNTESEEEDNVTLTKSDVDQLKNINNVVRKDLIDSMNNVFKMAESQIDYILHKRVKF
ncbi:dentin sialophosphoprotein-like isoform X3 [Teleopsis dalmanni]|uniref:dentin sialophosphoprotein-like isoform X3 n=1 Tax=Teleopsis dalmanni TaxID=139649 RepID=UPI0018CD2C16|nr:dentin sialophosphoprotein-like isoform X3 [Teleopsis dalmanni]